MGCKESPRPSTIWLRAHAVRWLPGLHAKLRSKWTKTITVMTTRRVAGRDILYVYQSIHPARAIGCMICSERMPLGERAGEVLPPRGTQNPVGGVYAFRMGIGSL